MKPQNNSYGFGIVEVFLLFLGVGIIVFTGWYVWQAKIKAYATPRNASVVHIHTTER